MPLFALPLLSPEPNPVRMQSLGSFRAFTALSNDDRDRQGRRGGGQSNGATGWVADDDHGGGGGGRHCCNTIIIIIAMAAMACSEGGGSMSRPLGGFHIWRPQNFRILLSPPCHCRKSADFVSFSAFWGPLPPLTADVMYGSPLS